MTHLLFLLKDSFLQTFKAGRESPLPIRGEKGENCTSPDEYKCLIHRMMNQESENSAKFSFLIPDDNFSDYARCALTYSEKFCPSAICLYRLSDFIESIHMENKERLSAEALAKFFFYHEDTPQGEEKKPEVALSPLATVAQKSKVEPIRRR